MAQFGSRQRLAIGIAGAGVLGRLAAWSLAQSGHRVTVFDPADSGQARSDGRGPAGFTAAGMLSPLAELENGGPTIAALGWRSLALWEQIAARLRPSAQPLPASCGSCTSCAGPAAAGEPAGLYFRALGSLLVAHPSDLGAAQRVLARLATPTTTPDTRACTAQALTPSELARLEPALAPGLKAWLLPGEGQILPHQILPALCDTAAQVDWRWGRSVQSVEAGRIQLDDGSCASFDLALDVRGVGARPALPVRGVRGELAWLHAPSVNLQRPVRLLHPRHRVYIVPRPGDMIVVGASEIESEDRSKVSLRSAVELLAAAHSVIPALAEARIEHLETNLRPALPDNHPHTQLEAGLLRINGLFRHGWLLAPALLQDAFDRIGLGHALDTTGPAATQPIPLETLA